MIIFHEGMPRSGKSFACTKDHIVPALKKGRVVFARLDGINFAQFAELAEMSEERCRQLLVEITEEQMAKIWELPIPKDALIVLDELQNYWPQNRAPLPPPMMKWIAEHGHHGWDIVGMGQLLKDCHRNWINRTNRKIQFIKKDMLGKPNYYKWIAFTGRPDKTGQVRFDEVAKGDGTYEEKYFGCYASHSDGTANADTYDDARANVFRSSLFRAWLPLTVICALLAIAYLVYLFKGGLVAEAKAEKPQKITNTVPANSVAVAERERTTPVRDDNAAKPQLSRPAVIDRTVEFDMPDIVTELSKDNRIRLAAYIRSAARTRIVIEWRDSGMRVIDRLDNNDLETLGWHVLADNIGRLVVLSRPGQRLVVTAWPIEDPEPKVPTETKERISAMGGPDHPPIIEVGS
ncbi:zonular occludens toxin domain-containing protein [Azonexus sp.]|jgi:zona occludens toxin|uniref:zonular occludens toxin domain-containing protein n=1 Tax=Azonexus sp. TaxID=1872668 RepID=UPI002824D6CE|nr:zonular occludens toxin domain-containing protein [Azonexus sp.]MDR1994042.1 zonular occludens toxin domain-containing protein [Azonexus sp.]